MKLAEIASRIDAHLKRFEADPAINLKHRGTNTNRFYQHMRSLIGAEASDGTPSRR